MVKFRVEVGYKGDSPAADVGWVEYSCPPQPKKSVNLSNSK